MERCVNAASFFKGNGKIVLQKYSLYTYTL